MPKKAPGTRWRYIAFSIQGGPPFARNDFLDAFIRLSRKTPLGDSFRITVFEDNFGILKVPHFLKDEAIAALGSVKEVHGSPCKVVTLKTSGTIKTLKDRYLKGEAGRGAIEE